MSKKKDIIVSDTYPSEIEIPVKMSLQIAPDGATGILRLRFTDCCAHVSCEGEDIGDVSCDIGGGITVSGTLSEQKGVSYWLDPEELFKSMDLALSKVGLPLHKLSEMFHVETKKSKKKSKSKAV